MDAWPSLQLDLELPASERWSRCFQDNFSMIDQSFRSLSDNLGAKRFFGLHGDVLGVVGMWIFGHVYRDEVYDLAGVGNTTVGRVALLNWRYEIDQYTEVFGSKGFGFRSSVLANRLEDGRIMVTRAMDAPQHLNTHKLHLGYMGNDIGEMLVFPGIVGSWTGIRYGAFGMCLCPRKARGWLPNLFNISPPTALRRILEFCPDYDSAVEHTRKTELSSDASFLLWDDERATIVNYDSAQEMNGGYLFLDNNGLSSETGSAPELAEKINSLNYQIKAVIDLDSIRKV